MRQDAVEGENELVAANRGLIHRVIKWRKGLSIEYEDAYSAGLEGLLIAVRGYAPILGASFGTYATAMISHHITNACRDVYAKKRGVGVARVSLESVAGCNDDGDPLRLIDIVPDVRSDTPAEAEYRMEVCALKQAFTEREQTIAQMILDGYSQREIGEALGVSQPVVSDAFRRIAKRHRAVIGA